MTRSVLAMLAAGVLLMGCGEDPARAVKIDRPAPAPPAAAPTTAPPKTDAEGPRPTDNFVHRPPAAAPAVPSAWKPPGCPPPPDAGPSAVTVSGPCAFELKSDAACEATVDDFLVTTSRPGTNGSTLMIFLNVEHYAGPGAYKDAQMFFGVQDKTNIYRWSSETVDVTVGAGQAFVLLPPTKLEAEPLLAQCSGPMNNFQCGGRLEKSPMDGTFETVTGTLQCQKTIRPASGPVSAVSRPGATRLSRNSP